MVEAPEDRGSGVDRTPDAVRKLASRARQHIERGRPRFTPSHDKQERLVGTFANAPERGDLGYLLTVLDPDVVWRSDGGGKVVSFREVRRGASTVARGPITTIDIVRNPEKLAAVRL